MRRLVVAVVVLAALAAPAAAVIIRLTALSEVIQESTVIVTVKVESLDPKRPSVVLALDETLKGKPAFKKLSVLLSGDAGAVKRKEPEQLVKRLAVKLPAVVFLSQRGKSHTAFGYTNGTWFSLVGTTVDGEVRWSLAHLEPYLHRTYKGTTAEMAKVVRDVIAGKAKAPPPDKKGKPGLGPEVKTKPEAPARRAETLPVGMSDLLACASGFDEDEAAHVGVVVPVLVGGPLAMLAMLFPTWFGGYKRWLVLLSIAGTNLTLYSLSWLFADKVAGTWWGGPLALWTAMGVLNVLGVGWAWRRHLARVEAGEAPLAPGRVEVVVLWLTALLGVATLAALRHFEQALFTAEWLPVVALVGAMSLAAVVALWQWVRGPRLVPALSAETVVLTGLALGSVVLGTTLAPAGGEAGGEQLKREWAFRVAGSAFIHGTPVVAGDRVYLTTDEGAFGSRGALYCLDRVTGEVVWRFDDDGGMRKGYSSPVVADGRVYFGEGLHYDSGCKVYCLDAATGEKRWDFVTGNHTESTPAVVGGRVYCGAGDDGLYCLDAVTGKKVWNFPGFHFDAAPVISDGRVYIGAGTGDAFQTTMMFCLEAATGKPVWRVPTEQPIWGRAAVADGRVWFGTGSGRVTDEDLGAGSVYCVNAADGKPVWRKKMPGGVMAAVTADAEHVYFGCRDGAVYCLDRDDGSTVWKRKMGGRVVSRVVLVPDERTGTSAAYAVSYHGLLACLDAATGERLWAVELARQAGSPVDVLAAPRVETHDEVRRIYVGLTLRSTSAVGELHCYEERREGRKN